MFVLWPQNLFLVAAAAFSCAVTLEASPIKAQAVSQSSLFARGQAGSGASTDQRCASGQEEKVQDLEQEGFKMHTG